MEISIKKNLHFFFTFLCLFEGQVFLIKFSRFKTWTHCVGAAHFDELSSCMLGPHPNP